MVRMNGSVIVPSFRIREEEAASAADANALGRGRAAEPVPQAARKTPRDRDTICVGTGLPGDNIDMRDHAAHTAIRDRKSTRELQSLMRISYAVFCLQKQK